VERLKAELKLNDDHLRELSYKQAKICSNFKGANTIGGKIPNMDHLKNQDINEVSSNPLEEHIKHLQTQISLKTKKCQSLSLKNQDLNRHKF
jgi:hypothetical protein